MTSVTLTQTQSSVPNLKKWSLLTGALLLVVAIAGGLYAWYASNQPALPASATMAEFEEISGFQPTMIVVTAGGGIVDFRFKVVNPDRVSQVMRDVQMYPRLVIDETGQVLNVGTTHNLNEYLQNAGYFLFYPNSAGVVKTGSELSVMVGNVRYGPIVVK